MLLLKADLYAPTQDKDKLLSQFNAIEQYRHESVREYYVRCISLRKEITDLDTTLAGQLDTSLRSIFWEGLHCQQLKSTLHYKYNSTCSTAELMKALVQEDEATQKQSRPARQHQLVSDMSNLQVDKKTKKEVRFEVVSERCQLCDKDGHNAKRCTDSCSKEKNVNHTYKHDVRLQRQGRGRWNSRNRSSEWRPHKQHYQQAEQDPTRGFQNVHNYTYKPATSQNYRATSQQQQVPLNGQVPLLGGTQ